MRVAYYVAFIVDEDSKAVDSGVDLLAGPFESEREAMDQLPQARIAHPFRAALVDMASHVYDRPPIRLAVARVTDEMVAAYNVRHGLMGEDAVEFPPRCVKREGINAR